MLEYVKSIIASINCTERFFHNDVDVQIFDDESNILILFCDSAVRLDCCYGDSSNVMEEICTVYLLSLTYRQERPQDFG